MSGNTPHLHPHLYLLFQTSTGQRTHGGAQQTPCKTTMSLLLCLWCAHWSATAPFPTCTLSHPQSQLVCKCITANVFVHSLPYVQPPNRPQDIPCGTLFSMLEYSRSIKPMAKSMAEVQFPYVVYKYVHTVGNKTIAMFWTFKLFAL